MKNKTLTGIIVIGLLLLSALPVYLADKQKEKEEKSAILSIHYKEIKAVNVDYGAGKYSIYKQDETWTIDDSENLIDTDKLTVFFTVASNIMGQVVPDDLDMDTGLNAPQKSIEFILDNNDIISLYIGNFNETDNFYYAKTNLNDIVYKVNEKTYESLFLPKNKIVSMLIYQISDQNLKQIFISNKENKPIVLLKEQKETNGIKYNWRTTGTPEEYLNEAEIGKKLLPYITSMTAQNIVEMDANNLSEYGLDKPHSYLQITQNDQKEIRVLFGNSFENKIYAKLAHQNKIFMLNEIDIAFMNINLIDLVDKRIFPFTAEKMKDITLTHKGKKMVLNTKWRMINGKEVDPIAFSESLSYISNLSFHSFAQQNVNGKALYSIRFDKKNGKTDTLDFLPLPDDYLLVKINGNSRYVVKDSDVEKVWTRLVEIMLQNTKNAIS